MTVNSVQITQQLKKTAALALLVAVTFSTMPVKSALADANEATSTFMGTDVSAMLVAAAREISKESEHFTKNPAPVKIATELAEAPKVAVVRTYASVPMTAYTSRPEETDDTPFITADGSHVRDGIVACNFLPFGTKVRIPKLFGDKVFEVHDRMNKRFPYKMDFWMEELGDARQFGLRRADIEVVTVEQPAPKSEVAMK
jgi:3D (Asp-Asp-Asp) domain-containing protein